MKKIIRNDWCREPGDPFARAHILSHETHPEGLNIDRIRFFDAGELAPRTDVGHIVSVLRGIAVLRLAASPPQ